MLQTIRDCLLITYTRAGPRKPVIARHVLRVTESLVFSVSGNENTICIEAKCLSRSHCVVAVFDLSYA